MPGVLGLGIIVYWAATGGGYESLPGSDTSFDPNPWYLGALGALALVAVTAAGLAGRIRLGRAGLAALATLGLYVLFSYASTTWAQSPGDAFAGANRTLVYFAFFALFAILPWTPRGARTALGILVAGVGIVVVVQAVRIGTVAHPFGLYNDGRLATPLDYQNANAAFFNLTALLGITLGSRREVPWPLRAGALTLGGLCLQLAVLCESRGWLFTLPVVLLAAIIAVPNRVRLGLFALAPVVATLTILDPLLAVFREGGYHGAVRPEATIDAILAARGAAAGHAMLVADIALLVVGLLAAWADSRVKVSPRASRISTRAAAIVAVLALLGGTGVAVAAVDGHVGRRIDRAWQEFKDPNLVGTSATHFTQIGSGRYDFWRVGLGAFARHPVGGIGQDNFAEAYVARRRTDEEPRWTHSLEVRLLTHTGVIGAALFLAFLMSAVAAASRARGRRGTQGRAAAGIALLPLAVWLAHGSVDWLWEYPVLSATALALLGMAAALGRPAAPVPPPLRTRSGHRAPRIVLSGAGAIAAVAALAALFLPYLAERDIANALASWPTDPRGAFAALDRAADLEPLSSQPGVVGGAIALQLRRPELARKEFAQVGARNPGTWVAPFFVGLLTARRDPAGAAYELRRAQARNPHETLSAAALSALQRGRPLTLAQVTAELDRRRISRFGR